MTKTKELISNFKLSNTDIIFLLLMIVSILMRLLFLDNRAIHHDEGVNGWFVMNMWKQGYYHYDPANFHGPLFFYLLQISEAIFGKGIFSLRFVAVLFLL